MSSLKAPTPEQVDAAIARLGKPGANAYFFDNLKNPLWIEPLAKRGFFRRPPDLQRNEGEGTVSFPDWPELRYLLRMASDAPDAVGKVVVDIPDSENARVRHTLVDIGTHLNRQFSKAIGLRTLNWTDNYFLRFHFAEPVPKLISRLAEQGEVKLALEIARRLFRANDEDSEHSRSSMDGWQLERYLAACLPTLRTHAGIRTLELLRDLLLDATSAASRDKIEDYSYIWRTSILKANLSTKSGRDVLIDALRDTALEFARDPDAGAERVCRLLLSADRPLLKRIALYVASQASRASDPIVVELLRDLSLVDRLTCHDEYAMLLQAAFPHLAPQVRISLEQLVLTDPLQSIPEATRQEMEAGKLERIAKQVLRDRLLAFGPSLPDSLTAVLAELLREVGERPERRPVVVAWGPKSPLSNEQIESMSVERIADYAKTWVSSNDFDSSKPEGLARAISGAIKVRFREFAEQAEVWIGQDPTYVRWVITAIAEGLRNKAVIENWTPLFRLMRWATVQEDTVPMSADDPWAERDLSWRWTRQSVAGLIETALQHEPTQPNFRYRNDVWEILDRLLADADPVVDDKAHTDESPITTSINSTRGVATHALMQYIWWAHSNTVRTKPFTLDIFNEAKDALESALTDTHPAILSVFGEWFRQLYFLDEQWTRAHVGVIFPEAEDRMAFWQSSWHTFVEYSPPHDEAFELLRTKYELSVARVSAEQEDSSEREGDRGLGRHLSSYFWRGVGGDFTYGLLLGYFDKCSPKAAGQLVDFIGRGLATEKDIPAFTIDALIKLWEELRRRSTGWNEQKRREVARQFDQWFISKQMPPDWRLRQLEGVLNDGVGLDDMESAFAELALLVESHPQQAARCLQLLLVDQQQSWYPLSESASMPALDALLASDDALARSRGLDIVNRLVEGGSLAARDIARRASLARDRVT